MFKFLLALNGFGLLFNAAVVVFLDVQFINVLGAIAGALGVLVCANALREGH